MLTFLGIFTLLISLYHIITTFVGFQLLGGDHLQTIALTKEMVWVIFFLIIAFTNVKLWKSYFQRRKFPWMLFIGVVGFGILISLLQGKDIYSMIVGIKYDFHFLLVFLSASFVGFSLQKLKLKKLQAHKLLMYAQYFLLFIIVGGFIWQITKFIKPNLFTKLGYGPIGDFIFGQNPPVYYRTGPGGSPRWQGLFSGPNNYGYFLVAFFPLILARRTPKRKKLKDIFYLNTYKYIQLGFILLRLGALALTLSRAALIGGVVALFLFNKQRIKNLPSKRKKLTVTTIGILVIGGITALSIFKRGSTKEHLISKFGGIIAVINQPQGHGLGTAGPAIHHNGSILPENYYLQLMIDIGTIGFILWTLILFHILLIKKYIIQQFNKQLNKQNTKHSHTSQTDNTTVQTMFILRKYFNYGRACLLLIGLFLHVFEDSMVNYIFFVPYGILTGYLSIQIPQDKITKFKLFSFIKELKKPLSIQTISRNKS